MSDVVAQLGDPNAALAAPVRPAAGATAVRARPGLTAARNIIWLLLSQVATWSMSVVLLVLAPRMLGDEGYGQVQFAVTYVAFFVLAAGLGIDTYLVKTIARDPAKVGHYVLNAMVVKAAVAVMLAVGAVGLAVALGYDTETIPLVAVSSIAMIISVLSGTIVAGLQGLERMGGIALWAVVSQLVSTGFALVVLYARGSLLLYMVAISIGGVITLVANGTQLLRHTGPIGHIEPRIWKVIVLGGLPFLVWQAVLLVYGTIDIPLLQSMAGSETVAWYTLAYRWISLPAFFCSVVVTAMLPSLSAKSHGSSHEFRRHTNASIRLVFTVGLPLAVGLALVASDMMTILYGESEFDQAVPVMQVLAAHLPLVSINMMLGAALIASDRQRWWVVLAVMMAVLNIGLNIVAIPHAIDWFDNGAIGAAAVTVSTETLMLIGALLLKPAGVLDGPTARRLLGVLVAGLAMIPAVLAISGAWVGWKIVVGTVTFGVLAIATRAVRPGELRGAIGHLGSTLSRRTGPPGAPADPMGSDVA